MARQKPINRADDDDAKTANAPAPDEEPEPRPVYTDPSSWFQPFDPRAALRRRGKVGRRTKLTPKVRDEIAASIAQGLPNKYAAALAGVGERTFYIWLRRGRDDEEKNKIYAQFARAVDEARAAFVAVHLGQVVKASLIGDVSSSKWLLQNVDPGSFGSSNRRSITQHDGGDDDAENANGYGDYSIEDMRAMEAQGRKRAARSREELTGQGRRANPLEEENPDH